jgi:hypothetical protein
MDVGNRVTWEGDEHAQYTGSIVEVLSVQLLVECDDERERFVFLNDPTLEVLDG